MYRIAICDDEKNVCSQLENLIEDYMRSHYAKAEIEVFYTGESLCDYLSQNEKMNLIFLDIELPNINGVEVGNYIRNTLNDEITDIIYISSKTSYALSLFQCRPLDFLIKPLEYSKIENILDIVIKRNGIRSQCIEFQNQGITQRIALQQILYFRSDNKKIHIVLCSGEEKMFYGKLSELVDALPESVFIQIHKSYLINYDYVAEYNYNWIKMINNDVLNISKIHRSEVRTKLIQHEL